MAAPIAILASFSTACLMVLCASLWNRNGKQLRKGSARFPKNISYKTLEKPNPYNIYNRFTTCSSAWMAFLIC